MRAAIVAVVFAVFSLCSFASAIDQTAARLQNVAEVHEKFTAFQTKFNKTYATPQEWSHRFLIFADNLKQIEEMNAKSDGAVYGITQFSDMTQLEFKTKVLMPKNLPREDPPAPVARVNVSAPNTFDWRTHAGVVTPVYNQGQCGSCWAFSATENVESRWALAGHPLTSLSMQQIVSCDTTDDGCNGGFPYRAYEYLIHAGGQDSYSSYPYTARDTPCEFKAKDIVAKPRSWEYVTRTHDEKAMVDYLAAHGPISVCVDASTWSSYVGGVYRASSCGKSLDHCVEAVGYDLTANPPYWLIRNSWGTDWGIAGYMKLEYGHNACGVGELVTSALI